MRVNSPIFCDRVEREQSGKLAIREITHAFGVQTFPSGGSLIALYIFEFDPDEEGTEYQIRVEIQNPDMNLAGGSIQTYSVVAPYNEFGGVATLFVCCEVRVMFDSPGIYPTILVIDENHADVHGLLVSQISRNNP